MNWNKFLDKSERTLLFSAGVALLGFAFYQLYSVQIWNGICLIVAALLCIAFSNVGRFKRLKGLGFEAELWEKTKREAADLIGQLQTLVALYTKAIVIGAVKEGRWSNGKDWRSIWNLYDELNKSHTSLGHRIEITELKKQVDDYFLFDITLPLYELVASILHAARNKAGEKIQQEFGSPITQPEEHSKRIAALSEVTVEIDNLFELSQNDNLAKRILENYFDAQAKLNKLFDIEVSLPEPLVADLKHVEWIYANRPVNVTDALINRTVRN